MSHRLDNVVVELKHLLLSEGGQDLVEYALLVLLLSVGTLAAIPPLAAALAPMLSATEAAL